jgi:hypothetical protein
MRIGDIVIFKDTGLAETAAIVTATRATLPELANLLLGTIWTGCQGQP